MQLNLDAREVVLMRRLLDRALGEMREEVYKTENYEWRESLKDDEVLLKSLLERLGEVPMANPGIERVA